MRQPLQQFAFARGVRGRLLPAVPFVIAHMRILHVPRRPLAEGVVSPVPAVLLEQGDGVAAVAGGLAGIVGLAKAAWTKYGMDSRFNSAPGTMPVSKEVKNA